MKKIAIIGILSLCAAGAYAQGQLQQLNYFSGSMQFYVYPPSPTTPTVEVQGPTAADVAIYGAANIPNYSGTPAVYATGPIGTSSGNNFPGGSTAPTSGVGNYNYGQGANFSIEIYALSAGDSKNATSGYNLTENSANGTTPTAAGGVVTFDQLLPVANYYTTFATGANQGGLVSPPSFGTSGDAGIPGTGYLGTGSGAQKGNAAYVANNAFVAEAAWYNAGGTLTTLAEAQAANVPTGNSAVVLVTGLSEPSSVRTQENGGSASPADPPPIAQPYGITSFSLVSVPEPSTIALGVMGACAFLARRRKK